MNDEELLKALKEHKESCFHKKTCEICSIETRNDMKCDYCGKFYYPHDRMFGYCCKCELEIYLNLCYDCDKNIVHYTIIEQPSDENEHIGIYINDCCPMTKEAK